MVGGQTARSSELLSQAPWPQRSPLPTPLSLCLICSLRQLGRLSLVLAPAISHLCVTLKMCVEPGLGSELGRQLGVAWETTEEESCSTLLLRDRWRVVPAVPLSRATASYTLCWGLPDTHKAGGKTEVRTGGVPPSLAHWGAVRTQPEPCPPTLDSAHLLELQPRNTQPGGLLVSRPGLPP